MGLGQDVHDLWSTQPRWVRRPAVVGEIVNGATVNLFNIASSPIYVVACFGWVRTLFGAGVATIQLRILPTGGAQQALSAATAALNATAINSTIMPTGAVAVAPTVEATLGVSVGNMVTNPWILLPGVVNMLIGGATNAEGSVEWAMGFYPMGPDVKVRPL